MALGEHPRFTIKDKIVVGNDPTYKVETEGISKLIFNSLNAYPDFIGQIHAVTGEEVTFAQIKDRSIRCALWLQKQGISQDDVICMATPHQIDDYVPFLATIFIGAVINPWHYNESAEYAEHFFKMIKPKIVFASVECIDRMVEGAQRANLPIKFVAYGKHSVHPFLRDLLATQSQSEVDDFQPVEIAEPSTKPGVLYFSSGTTGVPKVAELCYDSFIKHRKEFMMMQTGMRAMWYSPFRWITGANFFTLCIRHRLTRVIAGGEADPERACTVYEKYKINWTFINPVMLIQMVKSNVFERYDLSSIKVFIVGGSKVSKLMINQAKKYLPGVYFANGYGITELGGLLTIQTMNCRTEDSIGYIVEGVSMKVVDPKTGSICGPNEVGELYFTVDCMMLGYLNNPMETKKLIDDEGWAHTGDLGFYDETGEISITDRIKELIIARGLRISPSQIEELLLRHPDVAEVAVVPIEHEIDVERPMAFVVRVPGAKVTTEELKELPTKYRPEFRLTGGVVFVDKLPYTSTDKKSLMELKEMTKAYL